jgi:hypothetical protein
MGGEGSEGASRSLRRAGGQEGMHHRYFVAGLGPICAGDALPGLCRRRARVSGEGGGPTGGRLLTLARNWWEDMLCSEMGARGSACAGGVTCAGVQCAGVCGGVRSPGVTWPR